MYVMEFVLSSAAEKKQHTMKPTNRKNDSDFIYLISL